MEEYKRKLIKEIERLQTHGGVQLFNDEGDTVVKDLVIQEHVIEAINRVLVEEESTPIPAPSRKPSTTMGKIMVDIYHTQGDYTITMSESNVHELATLLQDIEEPIPMWAMKDDGDAQQFHVVGLMIRGRAFKKYPRVIVVGEHQEG